MPHQRATRRHAAAVIVGSRDTLAQEPRNRRHKYVYIPENAIDPARFTKHRTHQATRPLRLVHVGRLVPYKGADMLLEAAAPLIRDRAVSVDLIGEGPHRPELERIIQHLGIQDGAVLRGQVPHEQLQDELIQYDVLAFPSIREFGGAVVLEAMSLGLVPIIVDYAGPAELVDEHTGFKVPIGPREQIVAGFRDRIQRLVDDPASIEAIGPRCRQRVFDYFTWQAKAEQTYETWRWVTGRRPDKPDFGMPLGGPAAEPKLAEL
jgi:glycosyltransferase involved in cell wall biosynthesis